MEELLQISDHIVFNSERQLRKYGQTCREAGISVGLRLNPQCSTQGDHALYDPCAPGSRFGVTSDKIPSDLLDLVDGLHFLLPPRFPVLSQKPLVQVMLHPPP